MVIETVFPLLAQANSMTRINNETVEQNRVAVESDDIGIIGFIDEVAVAQRCWQEESQRIFAPEAAKPRPEVQCTDMETF